jgi:ParB/RepB/Spo0J family partition protein
MLNQVQDNPFNSRVFFEDEHMRRLASSINQLGLLQPVKVRRRGTAYELAYGHGRVRAARLLGWTTIPAEIADMSDEELCTLSLAENMEREDLSDYEIGLCLGRLHKNFNKSYDEIGSLIGYSKQHVSNLIAMTKLFDEEDLRKDPTLRASLLDISEHHARLLSRIDDRSGRANALRLIVSEGLSVRDLQRAMQKLGGWFDGEDSGPPDQAIAPEINPEENDVSQIRKLLISEYELPHTGDFQRFSHFHNFNADFSIIPSYLPTRLYEGKDAYLEERNWFYSIGPKVKAKIEEMKIRFFGDVALALLTVNYDEGGASYAAFGSVLFVKRRGWRIVHEHWSKMNRSGPLLNQ